MVKNWRKAGAGQPLAKSLGSRPDAGILFGSDEGLRDTVMLRLQDIEPNPHQPRRIFDPEELAALARSLEQVGQLVPVLVTPDPDQPKRYVLVAGERRWRAAALAALPKLMAHIVPADAPHDQIALIENLQRVDLSPVEEAEGIKRLIDTHEYGQEAVGDLLGRSRTEVNTTLTLLRLHTSIRQGCVTSHTPLSKAVLLELARMEHAEQLQLWPLVKDGRMTAREARDHRTRQARQQEAANRAERTSAKEPPAPTPKRFLASLPKLEEGLESGLKAVAAKADRLKPAERQRLTELRDRLDAHRRTLDGILAGR